MFKKLWNSLANNPVMLAAFAGIVSQVALELQTGLAEMEKLTVTGVVTLVLGIVARQLVTPTRKLNGAKKAGSAAMVLLVALAIPLTSCAAFQSAKPYIRTVDEAMAIILCKQAQAQKAGIDFKDVKDAYCDNREHFAPFLAQARAGLAAAQSVEPE